MELRNFVSFFFGLIRAMGRIVDSTEKLNEKMPEADRMPRSDFVYNYSTTHRQFVNELLLSRAVDTFQLYVVSILREIFSAKPEMLKSEGTVEAATILDLGSYDEIVRHIVEKKLNDLSYQPLSELTKYIQSRTGVELFPDTEQREQAILAYEIRNLIAHNACQPNEIFRRRTANLKLVQVPPIRDGQLDIGDEWVRQASYAFDRIAFTFDSAVIAKFNLPTVPGMTPPLDQKEMDPPTEWEERPGSGC